MLKNKLYENVKPYFDKYLFEFDASQIEISVLKGIQNQFGLAMVCNKKFRDSKCFECELEAKKG